MLPANPTSQQRKAFEKRYSDDKRHADALIHKCSQETESILSDGDQIREVDYDDIDSNRDALGTSNFGSGLFVDLDGVRFKKNDETEFRRVLIQNFIKAGNLDPLTDKTNSSHASEGKSIDSHAQFLSR